MRWFLGGLFLVIFGSFLRRVLHIGPPASKNPARLRPLRSELDAMYGPVAQEVETHTAILGITLNDAFQERDASRFDLAWHMVQLSAGEWFRLEEIVAALLSTLTKYLASTPVVVPTCRIMATHFKSRVMADHLRMYELLDRLVFRSHKQFQLRVRMLRRATESLSKEFRHTYRYMEKTQDHSPEVWERYDRYFHDFDLIAKETLLSFRSLLACLPPEILSELSADLQALLQRGVRTPSVVVDR